MEKGKKILKQRHNLCAIYAIANFANKPTLVDDYIEEGVTGPIDFVEENILLNRVFKSMYLNYQHLDVDDKVGYERFKELVSFDGEHSNEFIKPYALLMVTDYPRPKYHRVWIFLERSEFGNFVHALDTRSDTMVKWSYDMFYRSHWIAGVAALYNIELKSYVALHKDDLAHLI